MSSPSTRHAWRPLPRTKQRNDIHTRTYVEVTNSLQQHHPSPGNNLLAQVVELFVFSSLPCYNWKREENRNRNDPGHIRRVGPAHHPIPLVTRVRSGLQSCVWSAVASVEKYWTVPHSPETLERIHSLSTGDRIIIAAAVEAVAPELPEAQVKQIVTALDGRLTLQGYSSRTLQTYRLHTQRFLKWLRQKPGRVSQAKLRSCLFEMLNLVNRSPQKSTTHQRPSTYYLW
jgi:hypothetical protein